MSASDRSRLGEPALEVLESALLRVRGAGAPALAILAAGALPFALGVLWFWADMSRGVDAGRRLAAGALGLAVLFVWHKTCQTLFAERIRARLAGQPDPPLRIGRVLRIAAVQAPLQATGLLVLPLTSLPLLLVPTPWVWAFYQSLTVTAGGAEGRLPVAILAAVRHAVRWPGQNHGLVALLIPLAATAWLNIAIVLAAVPWMARVLLGLQTEFVMSVAAVFNTTFLATVTVLTGVVLDPFIKAAYAIRCFHADALTTGDDLRAELHRRRAVRAAAAAAVLLLAVLPAAGRLQAAPPSARIDAGTPAPAELDRAIEQVLSRPEYRWRAPRAAGAVEEAPATWQERLGRRVTDSLKWLGRRVGDAFQSIARWVRRLINGPSGPSLPKGGMEADWSSGVTQAGYVALTVAILAAGAHALRRWLRGRRPAAGPAAGAPAPAAPDLTSDAVQAGELPEEEWLRMAATLGAAGDWRLALRAVHLALLAHLAGREWVRLARHKTNRDYAAELARRARRDPGVAERFADACLTFERAWYGNHPAGPGEVDRIRAEIRRLQEGDGS